MKLNKLPKAILFDLDGTIAHTVPQLALAAVETALQIGISCPSEKKVQEFVGNGINMLLCRVIAGKFDVQQSDIDPELLKRAREAFNVHYMKGLCENFTVYDGVVQGLKYFQSLGIKNAVVTNKPQVFADPLLDYMGLSQYFDFVLGGEVISSRKPDPAPLFHVLKHLNVAAEDALMCGDSDNDIIAGNRAGVSTVFFTYGYNRSDVNTLKYDYSFDSFNELSDLIRNLNIQ